MAAKLTAHESAFQELLGAGRELAALTDPDLTAAGLSTFEVKRARRYLTTVKGP
jgi:hypothetical protein